MCSILPVTMAVWLIREHLQVLRADACLAPNGSSLLVRGYSGLLQVLAGEVCAY